MDTLRLKKSLFNLRNQVPHLPIFFLASKIILILFGQLYSLCSRGKKKKSLKSHEHGVGVLNIVQEKNILQFEYEMPGYDIVGFEYKAEKKEDVGKVEKNRPDRFYDGSQTMGQDKHALGWGFTTTGLEKKQTALIINKSNTNDIKSNSHTQIDPKPLLQEITLSFAGLPSTFKQEEEEEMK